MSNYLDFVFNYRYSIGTHYVTIGNSTGEVVLHQYNQFEPRQRLVNRHWLHDALPCLGFVHGLASVCVGNANML